jgi:hypothetical protein
MRRKVFVMVGLMTVVLAALVYLALPVVRTEAAGIACGLTLPGNGAYTVEWRPLPFAHWECMSTPEGEPTRTIDLGWWPG